MPSYSRLIPGTSKTWINTGGDKVLTLTSLANGSVRQGDKSASVLHATYGRPEFLEFLFETACNVAGTNYNTVDLYIGESDSSTAGTNNPGGLSGADGALTNGTQLIWQLRQAGSLIVSNGAGTGVQKVRLRLMYPMQEYVIPVVANLSGQALHATASNHKLTMTPFYREIG